MLFKQPLMKIALAVFLVLCGIYMGFAATSLPLRAAPEFIPVKLDDQTILHVGQSEVTMAQWQACVSDGGCREVRSNPAVAPDYPVTGINYYDAYAYASWLGKRIKQTVRLPTRQEWLALAGQHRPVARAKLFDDPNLAWAADYDITAEPKSRIVRIAGSFGSNEYGLSDFTGNIWEWTVSCGNGQTAVSGKSCPSGQVAMGEHVAVLSALVNDPGNAGCGGGTPPANLGLRVVY